MGDTVNLSQGFACAARLPSRSRVEHCLGDLMTDIRDAAAAFGRTNDQVTQQAAAAALKAEGWNVLKQLAAIGGLYVSTFVLLNMTASTVCMSVVTVLPVALGGFALDGPDPAGSRGSCFQFALKGYAMLSAVMLAVTAIELTAGFGLVVAGERIDLDSGIICDVGMENEFEGLEPAKIDATAEPAATVPLVFEHAATAGLAAFVP